MSNQTTQVVGYFNGNPWPVQIVISRLNVTLHLKPGEFILDRAGRKINDPFFDTYVKSHQLHRETATNPVPLVVVPQPPPLAALPNDGQSVRQVTEFTVDKNHVRHPVMPVPKAIAQPSGQENSVKAMTVDEARKRGLIRPTRPVPEDYGAEETDGTPQRGSNIPEITFARDTSRGRKPAPLPKELTMVPKDAKHAPERQALVQTLANAPVVAEAMEAPTGFLNTVVHHGPPDAPVTAGEPTAEALPEPPVDEPEMEPTPPPGLAKARNVLAQPINLGEDAVPLPEPSLEAEPVSAPARSARPVMRPVARLKPAAKDAFTCPICKTPFKFRSDLVRHAKSHPEQYAEICAAFPATVGK